MKTNKVLAGLLALVACCAATMHASAQLSAEDEKLQSFFKGYMDRWFEQEPTTASSLGDHRFDSRLDDISPEARKRWLELAVQTRRELPKAVDYKKLSRNGQIDFKILDASLESRIWSYENEPRFEKDPRTYGSYLVDTVYSLLTQSTLPRETNISNAISRMRQMPRIVPEAKRSLKSPSKPILETAITQNQGAIYFYEKILPELAADSPQLDTLKEEAVKVVALLKDYQGFLEGPARERAQDNWRLGKAKFSRKFELETESGVTADENLKDALEEFDRVQMELYVVARQLWPTYFPNATFPADDAAGRSEVITKVIGAVNQEHSDASELLKEARATVADIKGFIRDHDYLRLPEPDRCDVLEMPEFRRGNSLAYLENAPPLDPGARSVYAISPPPAGWTDAQVRSFLEEYNRHMLKILTIHEGYPGHYVQLEYANRQPSLIRRVMQSGPYIEGWAVYGEITMLNAGFGNGDPRLRLMQLKFYLRAVANSILDYRMHCSNMSDEEAMKFLMEGAFQTEGEAKLKVIRAKQSSVQLSTYFVGRMAHYRLRQSIQRELGDAFVPARYHEAVLEQGSVPPKYLPELVRARLKEPR